MSGVLGPNVIGKALRQILVSITPTWLVNNPQARNLFSFLYEVAVLGDALREIAWEGQLAAYPGVGTPDAFPYIAQSRGLTQGANEPNAAFALRCIFYRQPGRNPGPRLGLRWNFNRCCSIKVVFQASPLSASWTGQGTR